MSVWGRSIAVFGVLTVLIAFSAPVAAAASPTRLVVDEVRMPTRLTTARATIDGSPPPCQDNAYKTLGAKQTKTYKWSFKASTTPSGLNKSAVVQVLKKSFANVIGAHNDCGKPDNISATHKFLGRTTHSPNCNSPDGQNVVGFAKLGPGILAVTCFWINGNRIIEADMKITTAESWALSMATCHGNMPLLESTITHEAGHVFGLGHVSERKHGRLTMSPFIDGPCENNEATLGLGDLRGLASMY